MDLEHSPPLRGKHKPHELSFPVSRGWLAGESQSFPEQSKCPQKQVKMVGGAETFSPCDHDRAL